MTKLHYALTAAALMAAACSSPATDTPAPAQEAATPAAVPAEIAAVVSTAVPGITITNGDPGETQYEVTGTLPDGGEVELDLVQANGAWTVDEIQRDVPWSTVPEPVRAAALAERAGFEPVRVIESRQPADGSIVYELFAPPQDGTAPRGPAMEVRWLDGKAAVLPREGRGGPATGVRQ